ncbi:MAG: hypothetical protein MJY62_01425 [Bacteroidales bacterium]|nr:hypothetical protein [Bacteroidales bacterium]
MKRFCLLALIFSALAFSASAQNYNVREEVASDWYKFSGLDNLLSFDVPELTQSPKGYKPFYVSHYGRHGSRYAYMAETYKTLWEMMHTAADNGNLTEFGERLLPRLDSFYEKVRYHVGELTPLGWEQHREIARRMVAFFPEAFPKGARVDAASSPTQRAIVSMTSFCTSLAATAPYLDIYAHQGSLECLATSPNLAPAELRTKGPGFPFPFEEPEVFFEKCFPDWRNVYSRIFKDVDAAFAGKSPSDVSYKLQMLIAGVNSLPSDVKTDFSDILTGDEPVKLWEYSNFVRFKQYRAHRTPYCSVVCDFIDKADRRISLLENGEARKAWSGADLRFGHDHVMMALYQIMDIEHFGHEPESSSEVAYWFQDYESPMATNIQFVFYRPKKGSGPVLVKLIRNGVEVHLGDLPCPDFPYYRWDDVREFLLGRVAHFTGK